VRNAAEFAEVVDGTPTRPLAGSSCWRCSIHKCRKLRPLSESGSSCYGATVPPPLARPIDRPPVRGVPAVRPPSACTYLSPFGGARDLFTCPYTDYRKQGQIVLVFGVSCALAAAGRPAARPTDRLSKRRKNFPPFLGMLRGKRKGGQFVHFYSGNRSAPPHCGKTYHRNSPQSLYIVRYDGNPKRW
jgi:hypothetical protein